MWSRSIVELFRGETIDHAAQILCLRMEEGSKRPFRVFNSWFNDEGVKSIVNNGHHCIGIVGKWEPPLSAYHET